MEHLLYLLARAFLSFIQVLPVRWVARMGALRGRDGFLAGWSASAGGAEEFDDVFWP